jgi:uncharacterized membrane protein YhaH (DUF805 family)
MSVLEILFSFEGRVRRLVYWLVPVAFVATAWVVMLGAFKFGAGLLMVVIFVAIVVLGAWMSLAIAVKRLQDRDKSGHWLWLFYLTPTLLSLAAATAGAKGIPGIGLSILSLIISLWGFIELGFLRGTTGGNIYGEDPLDH